MLGERIADLRKDKGISQEELADVLLTSRQAISKWERGESDPDIDRLKDLAIYFNVSIDYLLGYDVESTSVNGFIERITKCIKEQNLVISIDEVRMIVSRNNNSFHLIINAINYLGEYYAVNRGEELTNLIIEYCQKAILLYQPNNALNLSINDIHRMIASAYIFQNKYDLAKKYLEENNVYNSDDTKAECEFELGNYSEAEKIVSENFIQGVGAIINSNFIQLRIFIYTNKTQEAIDLASWSLDFIKSIGKNEDLFIDINFTFMFYKAACQKALGLDYSESLKFLKEYQNKVKGYRSGDDGIKFYNDQRITFIAASDDMKDNVYLEIEKLKKCGGNYQPALELYKEIYEGD